MSWIRLHRRESIAAAVALAGMIILALVAFTFGQDDGTERGSGEIEGERRFQPLDLPTPDAESGTTGTLEDRVAASRGSGGFSIPGLAGEGGVKNLPGRTVVLRMTSTAPIGGVGYIVPTSLNDSYGIAKNVGTSWSLTTTAYGRPDYAQLFAQAGARGNSITCTITVDGRVTERRSTTGPYGQLFCQG